jgi:hypothetical protein
LKNGHGNQVLNYVKLDPQLHLSDEETPRQRNKGASGWREGQTYAQGAGGRGDNLDDGKEKQQAREGQEQLNGPSSGAQKAMNIANV